MNTHLSFACDYMEGTHPAILQKLVETNLEKTGDPYTSHGLEGPGDPTETFKHLKGKY